MDERRYSKQQSDNCRLPIADQQLKRGGETGKRHQGRLSPPFSVANWQSAIFT
jgi:hypothetical protein